MSSRRFVSTAFGMLILILSIPAASQEDRKPAGPPLNPDYAASLIAKPPARLFLDPFYEKHVDAMGIPVIASSPVSDTALLTARDIVIHMLADRPDIRRTLVAQGQKIGIIGKDQQMSDIPEYRNLKKPELGDRRLTAGEIANYEKIRKMTDAEYWNGRARGLGGVYTTCGEENLLGLPGTRYFGEHILVHEFAHAIHRAVKEADPALWSEVEKTYADAMALGLWKGQYGSTNSAEYWAEGTQFWFWSNFAYKDGGTTVYSPAELRVYDPKLYELLGRMYPNTHRLPLDVFWKHRERSGPAPETRKD